MANSDKDVQIGAPGDSLDQFLERIGHLRHEINNPLMGILGNVELLLGDAYIPDVIRSRAEKIQTESRKIRDTVEEMGETVKSFRDQP